MVKFLLPLLLIAPLLSAQETPLRGQLENAYRQWRSAVLAQDAQAWAASITRYRQVLTRNLMVSQRQPFPQAVFAVPLDPPDVSGLRLLEAQAVGETAHLLYFGKINMGGDPAEIPDNLLMLKFFHERGAWRFDSSKLFKLMDQPELRQQLQAGGTPEFLDEPQFTPPGKAPAVPPLCNAPENMAGCTLQAYGYEAKLEVNGFDYPVMSNHAEKFFVIGGLNNGSNDVRLHLKTVDVPEGAKRLLQLDFFVSSGKPGQRGVRVFHHESSDPNLPAVLRLPLVIDAEILSKGR